MINPNGEAEKAESRDRSVRRERVFIGVDFGLGGGKRWAQEPYLIRNILYFIYPGPWDPSLPSPGPQNK